VCLLGDSCSLVVTDIWVHGSHKHQALIKQLVNSLSVSDNANDTVLVE